MEVDFDPQYYIGVVTYEEALKWVPPAGPVGEARSSIPFSSYPALYAWCTVILVQL